MCRSRSAGVRARTSSDSANQGAASPAWEGAATLEFFPAPGEEHDLLAPVRIGRGYRLTFAYTIDDLETVGELH